MQSLNAFFAGGTKEILCAWETRFRFCPDGKGAEYCIHISMRETLLLSNLEKGEATGPATKN
jgi:hypothetical protein